MSVRSHTLRNTLFSSIGLYTEYVLGMFTSIVIARHLGPDGFGAYSVVIWMVALGVAITNSGTASAAIKFVAELRGGDREELVPPLVAYLRRAQRGFLLAVLLLGGAVLAFAAGRVAPGIDRWLLLGLLVVAVSLRASYMFNIGIAKGFEDFRATAIVALVATPLNLALVVAAVWLDAPVEWLIGVFSASSVVFFLVSRRRLPASQIDVLPPGLLVRVRRQMLFSALTATVAFIAASEAEVLFLNLHGHVQDAGAFRVAYQLAIGAAALVPGVFGALMLPMMAGALSRGREEAGRRLTASTAYLALLSAPLVAFGAVFHGQIVGVLYGAAYASASWAFVACLGATSLLSMSQGASSLLISADRQRTVLLVVSACAVLKIVLNVALTARYGLLGAVIAFCAVAAADAVALMVLAIRASHAAPEWGRLLRTGLAASLAALAVLPLRDVLPPVVVIVVGGLLLAVTYLPLTLVLGCWSRGDIQFARQLHDRYGLRRLRVGIRLLDWALERAGGGVSP